MPAGAMVSRNTPSMSRLGHSLVWRRGPVLDPKKGVLQRQEILCGRWRTSKCEQGIVFVLFLFIYLSFYLSIYLFIYLLFYFIQSSSLNVVTIRFVLGQVVIVVLFVADVVLVLTL